MRECQWVAMDKSKYKSSISSLMYSKKVSEKTLLEAINKNLIYGFILCDIEPDLNKSSIWQKFLILNWLPIIRKDEIHKEDLSPFMQQQMGPSQKFPHETLIQSLWGKKILLHSDWVQFLLENGLQISKIHELYEYQPSNCFENFYDQLYKNRVEATREGQIQLLYSFFQRFFQAMKRKVMCRS